MKREGFPVLANTADVVSIPLAGLSATVEKIKQNRSQVKRVLKAEVEALRYLRDDAAVVNTFSRDGRIPIDTVENILTLEKKEGLIAKTVTVDQVIDASIAEEVLRELGR